MDQCCMINPSDIIWIWLCLGIVSSTCFFSIFESPKKSVEPRKKTSYFPLCWLFYRDPYNGSLSSLYDWVVLSPIIYPKQPSFFHCSLGGVSTHYLRQSSKCPTFNSRRDTKRRKVSFLGERKHGNTLTALGKSLVYILSYNGILWISIRIKHTNTFTIYLYNMCYKHLRLIQNPLLDEQTNPHRKFPG